MKTAIVTGASSGLGKQFALKLAEDKGIEKLWLIDISREGIGELAKTFPDKMAEAVAIDLTSPDDMEKLKKKLETERPEIAVMVNCAGFGQIGSFEEAPIKRLTGMIDLNLKALVELTHMTLPYMKKGSVIYNISSLNAYVPAPQTAVYSATKAGVAAFSQALFKELEPKGIHVIAVSPGPMDTQFMKTATNGASSSMPGSVDPGDVVALAIKDAKAKKIVSAYGGATKFNMFMASILTKKALMGMIK